MLIKNEEERWFYLILKGVPGYIYIRKILSDATVIMLERAICLVTMFVVNAI